MFEVHPSIQSSIDFGHSPLMLDLFICMTLNIISVEGQSFIKIVTHFVFLRERVNLNSVFLLLIHIPVYLLTETMTLKVESLH